MPTLDTEPEISGSPFHLVTLRGWKQCVRNRLVSTLSIIPSGWPHRLLHRPFISSFGGKSACHQLPEAIDTSPLPYCVDVIVQVLVKPVWVAVFSIHFLERGASVKYFLLSQSHCWGKDLRGVGMELLTIKMFSDANWCWIERVFSSIWSSSDLLSTYLGGSGRTFRAPPP